MHPWRLLRFALIWVGLTVLPLAAAPPPADFPQFQVPGHKKEMTVLRDLLWLHYPGAGPKATLWDEWLSSPALWPAVQTDHRSDTFRRQWNDTLSRRIIDDEGYVATHQHASIAHQLGWPFPFWTQGSGGYGWHFSFHKTVGPPWRPKELSSTNGWSWLGAKDLGPCQEGWKMELVSPRATATTPLREINTFEAPFLQLRWSATELQQASPYIEWATRDQPDFGPGRRVYFSSIDSSDVVYTMVPMFRHPAWTGQVNQLRIGFGNPSPGAKIVLQAFFTTFDTRHNINSQNFIRGCANYFHWTRDLDFLRRNINRMRTALRHLMTEHQALERKVVCTTWIGHDGRTGLVRAPDGKKSIRHGTGIGNNYWDLLPFGNLDAYATIHYYDALQHLAAIESEIDAHPQWQIPRGVLRLGPEMLKEHAAAVKAEGNRLFWNDQTGRFVACVDADGQPHDYGFTFLNLEAVCYDFATAEHARSILAWVSGQRTVHGDTAQGADLYHWRFGPRATTRRNIDWYFWAWHNPESIPWGGQVQDGGAVLGFSYHDLTARLKILGPDNAWQRLQGVLRWFEEVQAAGGYRKYYDGTRDGSLQGGGTPGGLGLDHEFFESVLVPQILLNGFLGFLPGGDGFHLHPSLPGDWPELTVDRIRFHDLVLRVRASRDSIEVHKEEGRAEERILIHLPSRDWQAAALDAEGQRDESIRVDKGPTGVLARVDWSRPDPAMVRFSRTVQP